MPKSSIERDIIRVLFILYFCGKIEDPSLFEEYNYTKFEYKCTRSIESETKLQKLDFWLRYPDYLASALLDYIDNNPQKKQEVYQTVRAIFINQEPAIRSIPMHKYLRGAYEPLDDIFLFLSSRSLAFRRVGNQNQYYLTTKGESVVHNICKECPESLWYEKRCKLLNRFFGNLTGNNIRERQYSEDVYKATKLTELINPIEAKVKEQFLRIFGEKL